PPAITRKRGSPEAPLKGPDDSGEAPLKGPDDSGEAPLKGPDDSGEAPLKGPDDAAGPTAQEGIQLTPLMWPVNKVTISSTPASPAASATSTRWPRTPGSTPPAAGWASSQGRKTRTESNPAPAARRQCLLVKPAS